MREDPAEGGEGVGEGSAARVARGGEGGGELAGVVAAPVEEDDGCGCGDGCWGSTAMRGMFVVDIVQGWWRWREGGPGLPAKQSVGLRCKEVPYHNRVA